MKFETISNEQLMQKLEHENTSMFFSKQELEQVPFVNSGMYTCFIASAFYSKMGTEDAKLSCTCLCYRGDEPTKENIIGKFSTSYPIVPTNRFYIKTLELGKLLGIEELTEDPMSKKVFIDGQHVDEPVLNNDGTQCMACKSICNKPFITNVLRKSDYISPVGKVIPNFAMYGVFNLQKQSLLEINKISMNALLKNENGEYILSDCKKCYNQMLKKAAETNSKVDNMTKLPFVTIIKKEQYQAPVEPPMTPKVQQYVHEEPQIEDPDEDVPF